MTRTGKGDVSAGFAISRTGTERLQRVFRVGLLPSAVSVWQSGRLLGGKVAARQRPQRAGLEGTAIAGDRVATEAGQGGGVLC
jgi:hypothetical protein